MWDNEIIKREYSYIGDKIYLNTCGVGLPPERVIKASGDFMSGYTEMLLSNGITDYSPLREEARENIACLIGARPDEIIFIPSTTTGNSILSRGYSIGKDDNVLTCDLENPSNLRPWIEASKQKRFELKIIKTQKGRITAEDIKENITAHTRVVALSAVEYGTGYYAPIKEIADICHENGAVLSVDAIQALGRLNINVEEMNIDFMSAAGYKGLLSGFGSGFSYCRKNLIDKIEPVCSSAVNSEPFPSPPEVFSPKENIDWGTGGRKFEPGAQNSYGITLLNEAVGLISEIGIENVEKHILDLEKYFRAEFSSPWFELLTPESENRYSGIIVGYYDKSLYENVERKLKSKKIFLTHRPGYIRFALGMHNTMFDIDSLLTLFLPLL